MSSFAPSARDSRSQSPANLVHTLEQHVLDGFTPELALELVLNELVVRAADATHASGAALALLRGDEMVCRASAGFHAPDLGIPLNTRDGLSGACVRTRYPQLSTDTESDPRVDPAISRRLGVRSMLVVPVFDSAKDSKTADAQPTLRGVLEVFSPLANAFSTSSQTVLEEYARASAEIHDAALHLRDHPPVTPFLTDAGFADCKRVESDGEFIPAESVVDRPTITFDQSIMTRSRPLYEGWTIGLSALVILAAAGMSFLIGSRTGWLRSPAPPAVIHDVTSDSSPHAAPVPVPAAPTHHRDSKREDSQRAKPAARSTNTTPETASDELVVYEKDKVVYRFKPNHAAAASRSAVATSPNEGSSQADAVPSDSAPTQPTPQNHSVARNTSSVIPAASNTRIAAPNTVWLPPDEAQGRLLNRVEPQYPGDALTARRSGDVVLEVEVAEDGTVSSVHTVSGDPLLAAAATEAVRSWRYQPYRSQDHPASFQTDVTLKFLLPN